MVHDQRVPVERLVIWCVVGHLLARKAVPRVVTGANEGRVVASTRALVNDALQAAARIMRK